MKWPPTGEVSPAVFIATDSKNNPYEINGLRHNLLNRWFASGAFA